MKCTCSALSRFSASSSARAGAPSRPGAAGLLVVGLERRRHGGVDHGAHVRLVHAHAERVGGADDAHVVGEEAALDVGAALALEPGVVGHRLLAQRLGELRRGLLGSRPRARVDDGRQRVLAAQALGDQRALLVRRRARHRERDVGPVEAGGHLERVAQAEAAAPRRPPRAAWPWRWRPRASPRRARGRRRPGGSSRAGSRAPTGTRSGPRRPRTARRGPPSSAP